MSTVSAIIPTHNRQELVTEAIQSVLAQSYRDFEIIVVDDGSTDSTRSVVQAFTDPRLRYIHQENAGLAAARNTGIRAARGDFVAFLDDDDVWFPEKLSWQVTVLQRQLDTGLVTGGWVCVDNSGTQLSQAKPWLWRPQLDLDTWLMACPAVPAAVTVRRDWLERAGGFDEALSRARYGAEDWDLWLRLAFLGCPMAWVEELVCAYRVNPGSMSRQAQRQRQGTVCVLDKFFAIPDLPDRILDRRNQAYAQAHLRGAARLYAAGLTDDAERDVSTALTFDPRLLEDSGAGLVGALTGWVSDPMVGDPVLYVTTVFDHLPSVAADAQHRRKSALGQAARQAFFDAHLRQDRSGVYRSLRLIAANQPRAILDRGVVSVLARTIVGPGVARLLSLATYPSQ